MPFPFFKCFTLHYIGCFPKGHTKSPPNKKLSTLLLIECNNYIARLIICVHTMRKLQYRIASPHNLLRTKTLLQQNYYLHDKLQVPSSFGNWFGKSTILHIKDYMTLLFAHSHPQRNNRSNSKKSEVIQVESISKMYACNSY